MYSACNFCAIPKTEMASLRYFCLGAVSTDTNGICFDVCSVDIRIFFFYYENVATSGKSDDDHTIDLLAFLNGQLCKFYHDRFALDG